MQRLRKLLVGLALLLTTCLGLAQDILPANQVFIPRISAVDNAVITVDIDIKSGGYYLYRQRLLSVSVNDQPVALDKLQLSDGVDKTDPFFGTQSIWYGGKQHAQLQVPYQNPNQQSTATVRLTYQGCQDEVICYPPETTTLTATLPSKLSTTQIESGSQSATTPPSSISSTPPQWSPPITSKPSAGVLFGKPKADTLLSEDAAFPFSIDVIDDNTLSLRWRIAEGYYLYRDKIRVISDHLSHIQLSQGQIYTDEFFGEQRIYRGEDGIAQLYFSQPATQQPFDIQFQGCADKGICFPIMQRRIHWEDGKVSDITTALPQIINQTSDSASANSSANATQRGGSTWIAQFSETLKHNIWLGIGVLLVAGLALSFTPCVLPMLPILLGIITNQRSVTRPRAALLSSAYALGVATMMALFGLVVAKTGINIQIIFQQPLWLILFAAIFILMGLAMLGVFSVAVPNTIQNKIYAWQNRFQAAKPSNLFVVGALSTLVVGPCVAPPLIAVLTFISTTNDSLLGAVYLFALGLGMSLPLVVFATVSTAIPKTGELSRLVTRLFAMLMFGVGLWLLSRLLPGSLALIGWGIFMLVVGWLFWQTVFVKHTAKQLTRVLAVLCFAVGAAWLAGGVMGNSNPIKPFTTVVKLPFTYINNSAELQTALMTSDKPAMLDLYADWCVSCQEIEHITFADPAVTAELRNFTLLKLDITNTDAAHRELLAELGLIGPPALLFFNGTSEMASLRNIGVIHANDLLQTLQQAKKQ